MATFGPKELLIFHRLTKNTFSYFRIDDLRPKSSLRKVESPATDGQKAVKFADDVGLPLVVVKEFKKVNYFEALSEEIKASSVSATSHQSQRHNPISANKSLSATGKNLPTSPSES